MTCPLIIIGILLPALGWLVDFFMDFVDDDHSLLHISLISLVRFSVRLASGVKRFEAIMSCSLFIDVTVGVFTFLFHVSPACSYTLDLMDRDGFGMVEASGKLPC